MHMSAGLQLHTFIRFTIPNMVLQKQAIQSSYYHIRAMQLFYHIFNLFELDSPTGPTAGFWAWEVPATADGGG